MRHPTHQRLAALLLACTQLGPPVAAQTSDAAYCTPLADMVQRYIGTTDGGTGVSLNTRTIWAIEQCSRRDPAAAIPILEKTLRDNRFTLPQR